MVALVDVALLLGVASIAGVVSNRFRVPPVLGLLLIGALLGPHFIGLVEQSELVDLLAELGAVLLLFAIGIEFSISKLLKLGLRIVAIAFLKIAIVFFLTFQLALYLGLDDTTALFLGAILSITSTALMIKIVEQKNFLKREEVPVLVASLIVEDVFAVFALTVLSSSNQNLAATQLVYTIFQSLFLLGATYWIALKVLKKVFDYIVKYQAAETMTLMGLAIGVGFSYMAQALGLTPSIGAFLAGSLAASLPRGELLEKSVSPFVLAFSSIFFLSIGLLIDFASIQQNLGLIAILAAAHILFTFFGTYASVYMFGFNAKQAAFSGIAMLSVGEFSLLLAREGAAFTTFDLIGATSAVVFVSTLFSSIFIERFEAIDTVIKALAPRPFRRAAVSVSDAIWVGTQNIENAGKSGFSAIMQNAIPWAFGIGVLAAGILLPDFTLQISGFTFIQLVALISVVIFAFAIQQTIQSLSMRKTKSVQRVSRIIALFSILILVPVISRVLNVKISALETILFLAVAVVLGYLLKISGEQQPAPEKGTKNVLFFKK